jgi:hypothetical protein
MENLSNLYPKGGGGLKPRFQEFLTSGTFTPSQALLDAGGVVTVELRGGGGGAGGSGGGGSSYLLREVTVINLNAITVTIGAGGAMNANGSNSLFGALLTCQGGGNGSGTGAGGAAGSSGFVGNPAFSYAGQNIRGSGGGFGGGRGWDGSNSNPTAGAANSGGGGGAGAFNGGSSAGGSGYCLVKWWE